MRLIATFGEVLPILVAAFLVAAGLALALTPLVRRMSLRLGTIDEPDQRRVNESPIPRGGGIAVAAAFLVVAAGVIVLNARLEVVPIPRSLEAPEIAGLVLGGVVATLIGGIDDALQLRARWQLLGQVVVALVAVGAGIRSRSSTTRSDPGNIVLGGPYAAGFTMLWIIGMINSINFIDGLDGLSSGIALIAAATLGLISLTTAVAQPFIGILCFALAGSLLGFLRWNFHPASIFIGTSGVMFVGYTLAVLAILGTAKVAVALLVLGVPIIDTFWIIVRRLAHRALAVHPGSRPHPPPAAGPRPVARPDRARHLRPVRRPGGALVPAVRDRAGVRVPGARRRVRAGAVPAHAGRDRRRPGGRHVRPAGRGVSGTAAPP